MGQAKLRRDALAKLPILTSEMQQQIAAIVRGVTLVIPGPGGMCLFRAMTGQVALEALGYETQLIFGGVMFAAAPGDINSLSMGGPGGIGMITDDGVLMGHIWLGRLTYPGAELIDFSCGDWHAQSDEMTLAYQPDLPLIDWQYEPPQYFWDDFKSNYATQPFGMNVSDELPLGKPRYFGFRSDQQDLVRGLQTDWIATMEDTAGPLFDSVRHFVRQLVGG